MEIYVSKIKAAKFFLIGLLGTSASAFVLWKVYEALSMSIQYFSPSLIIGIIFTVIGGIAGILGFLISGSVTVIFGKRFFAQKPLVLISSEGIEDRRLNSGLINWSEIRSISSHKMEYTEQLSLNLKSPENFQDRLPLFTKLMRKVNGESRLNYFRIGFLELDKPIDEAFDYILDVKFDNVICKKFGM